MPDLDDVAWEGIERTDTYGTVESDPRAGAYHRLGLRPRARREWLLRADTMPGAEADTLRAVFAATLGAGITTLTPPGESAVAVEFVEDELRLDAVAADTWSATVLVREVL